MIPDPHDGAKLVPAPADRILKPDVVSDLEWSLRSRPETLLAISWLQGYVTVTIKNAWPNGLGATFLKPPRRGDELTTSAMNKD